MSLVGTRPILQDELLKYELHHRARIAIKPGITGMWQVSGRSDITDFEEVVRLDTEYIGDRIASICASHDVTVDYAFQDINDIPGALPEGRTKPWGTGQAVLAAKKAIKTPFIVINADDYYGKEGFKAVHDYLVNGGKSCMAGFVLKNTLSDNGGVTRGICKMDAENNFSSVVIWTFGEKIGNGWKKILWESGKIFMEASKERIIAQLELETQEYSVFITDEKRTSSGSGVLFYPGSGSNLYIFTCAHVLDNLEEPFQIYSLLPLNREQELYRVEKLEAMREQVKYSPIDKVSESAGGVSDISKRRISGYADA